MLDRTQGQDTRHRIIETAERLFRDIGYQKTTVADIAKSLSMSPANVYRFFASKKAINEAVAERITHDMQAALEALAAADLPAATRLRHILEALSGTVTKLSAADGKMQEMVAVAMTESWQVIRAHIDAIDRIVARVLRDGVATGEFRVADPAATAPCIRAAMMRFCHPAVIAQCAQIPTPTLDQQVGFVLAALGYQARS